MFSVFASAVYGFFEKRVDNKALVTLFYFLSMGLAMVVFGLIVSLCIAAKQLVQGIVNYNFFRLVPGVCFLMGEIFAFFPWILGLRNSGDDTQRE